MHIPQYHIFSRTGCSLRCLRNNPCCHSSASPSECRGFGFCKAVDYLECCGFALLHSHRSSTSSFGRTPLLLCSILVCLALSCTLACIPDLGSFPTPRKASPLISVFIFLFAIQVSGTSSAIFELPSLWAATRDPFCTGSWHQLFSSISGCSRSSTWFHPRT